MTPVSPHLPPVEPTAASEAWSPSGFRWLHQNPAGLQPRAPQPSIAAAERVLLLGVSVEPCDLRPSQMQKSGQRQTRLHSLPPAVVGNDREIPAVNFSSSAVTFTVNWVVGDMEALAPPASATCIWHDQEALRHLEATGTTSLT